MSADSGPSASIPLRPGLLDRRADEPFVLLAEDAVLPGVRVEPGHGDAGRAAEQPPADAVGQLDGPQHARLGDRLDGLAQRAVRADMDHPQRASQEQHPQVAGGAQVGQHLGLARPRVPGQPQGLLGDRGGDQRVTVPGGHQPGRLADRRHGGASPGRRGPSERHRAGRAARPPPARRPGRLPASAARRVDAGSGRASAAAARSKSAGLPTAVNSASPLVPGSASARRTSSGPTPPGSPDVISTRGRDATRARPRSRSASRPGPRRPGRSRPA